MADGVVRTWAAMTVLSRPQLVKLEILHYHKVVMAASYNIVLHPKRTTSYSVLLIDGLTLCSLGYQELFIYMCVLSLIHI